jgi:hypothetical protein
VQDLGTCLQLAHYDLQAKRSVQVPAKSGVTALKLAPGTAPAAAAPPASTNAASDISGAQKPAAPGAAPPAGAANNTLVPSASGAATDASKPEIQVTLQGILPKCLKAAHLPNMHDVSNANCLLTA